MPLKIRIKPEGKLFINGEAVAKNVGNRPIDLLILVDDQVSRSEEHAAGVKAALKRDPCNNLPGHVIVAPESIKCPFCGVWNSDAGQLKLHVDHGCEKLKAAAVAMRAFNPFIAGE